MADFTRYFPILLANEGGYCHDLQDPGGETYRGIARASNPQWGGWPAVDAVKTHLGLKSPVPRSNWSALNKALFVDAGLAASINKFYKAAYWNPLSLDAVTCQCLAEQLADHGVNAGTTRPAKMLQYLLSTEFGAAVAVDGNIGPRTIAALNAVNAEAFYQRFVAMRRAFYQYRAGTYTPAEATTLAPWHKFFHDELHLNTDTGMKKFLTSWMSRTQAAYVA
ncbi:MAG: glycoside hydrolase family 108 protein [Janthinobacterium lividum]